MLQVFLLIKRNTFNLFIMEEKNTNTIAINGKEITLKPGTRAILIAEEITGKPFELRMTKDVMAYIYASMMVGTPDLDLDFDEFLDAMDNPQTMKTCVDIITRRTSIEKVMQAANDGGTEPKKD